MTSPTFNNSNCVSLFHSSKKHVLNFDRTTTKSDVKSHNSSLLAVGERVKIIVDFELMKVIQDGHGGWTSSMSDLIGKIGVVHRVTEKGDFRVKYDVDSKIRWTIYAYALNSVDATYLIGSYVRVNEDEIVARHVQKLHWNDELKLILGKVCRITQVFSNGDLSLTFRDKEYRVKRILCYELSKSAYEIPFSRFYREDCSRNIVSGLAEVSLSESVLVEKIESLIKYCANGNLKRVKDVLFKYPNIIDQKYNGKTALQASSFHGHLEIVSFLISMEANLEVKDFDGDTALHYCCFNNQYEIAELLLKNTAQINVVNKNGSSPLHVAVNKYHVECVKVLIRYSCDPNIQDSYGDAPLHDLIGKTRKICSNESLEILDLLLNFPAINCFLKNNMDFNIFQYACLKGNDFAIGKILEKCPDIKNVRKSDGFSGLHLAVLNRQIECVKRLIDFKADVEILNNKKQTPLLLAVTQFNVAIIEVLVENGANLNASDEDGDTCLHLLLNEQLTRKEVKISNETGNEKVFENNLTESKSLSKIKELIPDHFRSNSKLIVALYLIDNGADPNHKNKSNMTCFDYVRDKDAKHFLISYNYNMRRKLELELSNSKCRLCDEEVSSVIFLPCRHKIVCLECSVRLKRCIDCGQTIDEKLNSSSRPKRLDPDLDELLDKINKLEEARTCSICMERKKQVAFQCGHTVCEVCSHSLTICHICRETIVTKIRIYEN